MMDRNSWARSPSKIASEGLTQHRHDSSKCMCSSAVPIGVQEEGQQGDIGIRMGRLEHGAVSTYEKRRDKTH